MLIQTIHLHLIRPLTISDIVSGLILLSTVGSVNILRSGIAGLLSK